MRPFRGNNITKKNYNHIRVIMVIIYKSISIVKQTYESWSWKSVKRIYFVIIWLRPDRYLRKWQQNTLFIVIGEHSFCS